MESGGTRKNYKGGLGALLAILLALCAPAALAAERDQQVQIDIAAQSLASALETLAREAGIEILFDRGLVGPRRSAPLHGRMTPAQALARLLSGTGLTARRTSGGAYVIVRVIGSEGLAPEAQGLIPIVNRAPITPPPDPPPVAEVLVIGRRSLDADIQRRIDDIQPYQVFAQAQIASAQGLSLEDFFRSRLSADAQAMSMVQAPATYGGSTQSRIDLHGLGAAQTLVLVDGRRMPSAPALDDFLQSDLNGIPLAAIDRIETLTSTAGGIYGPGATGGVVNVILRRNIDGVELDAATGVTERGDGLHHRLDALAGGSFWGGRTRVTLALSQSEDDGLTQGSRDFTELARLRRLNLSAVIAQSMPVGQSIIIATLDGSRLRLSRANGGTVLGGGLAIVPFDTEGAAAVLATIKTSAGAALDASLSPDGQGALGSLVTRTRTRSAVFSLRQEITPDLEVFLDSLYLDSLGAATGPSMYTNGIEVGRRQFGNPFAQSVVVSFPVPGQSVDTTNRAISTRTTLGALCRLSHGWTGEADLTVGRALVDMRAPILIDVDAALQSQPGTNLFAGGSAITALLSGLRSPGDNLTKQADNLTDLNLRLAGPLAQLWGGPLTVTLLGELRRETNPGYLTQPFGDAATRLGRQKETVGSLYGEARAPLVARTAGGLLNGLEVQLAIRGDAYTISVPGQAEQTNSIGLEPVRAHKETVAVTTGVRLFPVEGLEVRGSFATGYLPPAPNQIVPEHFDTPKQDPSYFPADPRRGGAPLGSEGAFQTFFNGSPTLEPEKAVSQSAGVVLTPVWLKGLRLSIDYTRIDKSHEIREPDPGSEYSWLLAHEATFPSRVTRAPLTAADVAKGYTGGIVTAVDFSPINMGRTTIDTVDFNLDYRRPTRLGVMELYGQATWTPRFERKDDPFNSAFSTVGYIDGPLRWRGNLGARFSHGPWTVELNAQLFSGYRVTYGATDYLSAEEGRTNLVTQGDDKVPWQGYLDGLVAFAPRGSGLRIRFGVRNLLDQRPPLVFIPVTPALLGTSQGVDPGIGYSAYGDARGRRFELSVSKRF